MKNKILFLTDDEGKRHSVVILVGEYEDMLEHIQDLVSIAERKNEESKSFSTSISRFEILTDVFLILEALTAIMRTRLRERELRRSHNILFLLNEIAALRSQRREFEIAALRSQRREFEIAALRSQRHEV